MSTQTMALPLLAQLQLWYRSSHTTVAGLSHQQISFLIKMLGKVTMGDGDQVDRLPIIPARLIGLAQMLGLLDATGRYAVLEPVELVWELAEIEAQLGMPRPEGPYLLENVRWMRLTCQAGQVMAKVVHDLKNNLAGRVAAPLTSYEMIMLALVRPDLVKSDRLLSIAGHGRPLELVVEVQPRRACLRIAQAPEKSEASWLVPDAHRVITSMRGL